MREIDVQLSPTGVSLEVGTQSMLVLLDDFDVLADQVEEAALNKRGMEWVSRPVEEAEVGWFYGELEIVNVRPHQYGLGMTAVNFKAAPAFLLIESGLILRFTRPIQ